MISPALILLGCYLPLSPGVDIFLLPKLFTILAGCAIALILKQPGTMRRSRLPFLILIGAAALSAIASESPWQSFLGAQRSPTVGVLGLIAEWLCYEAGEPGHDDLILWGAAICGGLAIAEFAYTHHRASSTIGCPPFLGCMMALAVPLAWKRPWFLLPILGGLLASGSRAGAIGASAGLAWITMGAKGRLWSLLGLSGAAMAASPRVQGDNMRLQTWLIALRAFWAHPWLGVGPDNFTDAFMRLRGADWLAGAGTVQDNAHNLPLHVLATQGLVGVASWLNLGLRAPATASLIAVLAYGMFEPVPFQAWCIIAYQWGASECEIDCWL